MYGGGAAEESNKVKTRDLETWWEKASAGVVGNDDGQEQQQISK
jgi:hypothetical protein